MLASSQEGVLHEVHLLLSADQSFSVRAGVSGLSLLWLLHPKTMQSVTLALDRLGCLVPPHSGQTLSPEGPEHLFQFSHVSCFKSESSARNCGAGNLHCTHSASDLHL